MVSYEPHAQLTLSRVVNAYAQLARAHKRYRKTVDAQAASDAEASGEQDTAAPAAAPTSNAMQIDVGVANGEASEAEEARIEAFEGSMEQLHELLTPLWLSLDRALAALVDAGPTRASSTAGL